MSSDRSLEGLAVRYDLTEPAIAALDRYAELLQSDPLAPTTVTDPQGIRDDHFADALVALELEAVRTARTIADLGSGAGIPGLPLAAVLPSASVTLLDGSSRKCAFMRRAAEVMGATNVSVLHERAETWRAGAGRCDVVTARALADLDIVAEYAAPLLAVGGSLVAWRGRRDPDVEAAGQRAAAILGLTPADPLRVTPYPGAQHRHLHVFTKTSPTPDRFPRRDGVARKRPLGREASH